MYFVQKSSWIYRLVLRISPATRYGLMGMILFTIFCIWYLLLFGPAKRYLEQERAKVTSLVHELQESDNIFRSHKKIVREVNDLQRQWDQSPYHFRENFSFPCLLLTHYAQQYNLSVDSCSIAEIEDCSWYFSCPLQVSFSGDIANLLRFFYSLPNFGQLVSCSSFDLGIESLSLSMLQLHLVFYVLK